VIEKLHVSADSPIPRYLQIKSQLEYLIVTGQLAQGSKLPSIRELTRALGIGSATLVRAYHELEAAGLAVSNGGVGFFVLGNDTSRQGTHGEVRDQIRQLLHRAARDGLSVDQVTQIFMAQVADLQVDLARPEVVIVSKREGRIEELAVRVRHALTDLNVSVLGVSLEDLANGHDGCLARVSRARYVLALLFDIKHARSLLQPHGIEIIPLLMTPSEEVRERIVHLPPGTTVGIVASGRQFVDGMITAVAMFNSNLTIVGGADTGDARRLKKLIAQVDCLIYGTLSRRTVGELLPRSVEAIELMYVPDESSIQRLRTMLIDNASSSGV
jgi:DNA-binding transcriptional regulator YhcF (GntR family)